MTLIHVIVSFRDGGTEDVWNGRRSKVARKTCPDNILDVAHRKLDMINQAVRLNDLKVPPENRLEGLKGDRAGQCSVRINDQFRVCLYWTEAGATDVEITDYH